MATVTSDPLNALLSIRDGYTTARWNFADAVGTPVSAPGGIGNGAAITYSFLTSVPAYFSTTGFAAFSETEKQAARDILASISDMVDLTFTEVAGVGAITFGMNAQTNSAGYAYYPIHGYYYAGGIVTSVYAYEISGDLWLNSGLAWTEAEFAPGGVGYGTLVHEMGHALGLKHPFETDSNGYILTPALDNQAYTVMSYTSHPNSLYRTVTETTPGNYSVDYQWIEPETLMPLDIVALQYLYGANTTAHAGNDTYTFATDRPFIKTIWDTAGVDTISVANFTLGCEIDLRAGNLSSIHIPSDPLPPGWYEPNPGIYDGSDNLAIAYGTTIENAIGGSGNDQLTGNDVANDLDGGAGADTLIGGLGNDTYHVDNTLDVVTENSGAGTDIVYASASCTLSINVENLRIDTAANVDATGNASANIIYAGTGNNVMNGGNGTDTLSYAYSHSAGVTVSLAKTGAQTTSGSGSDTVLNFEKLVGTGYDDTLTGNTAANSLVGSYGNDLLNGGAGLDTLVGGKGNDTYVVDLGTDIVTENANEGTDTVNSSSASYTLAANVENLLLTGSAVEGIGNTLANSLTGNASNNTLRGLGGNDSLNGSNGADTLIGGAGDDVYYLDNQLDTITELAGEGTDQVYSAVTYTLAAEVENLTLTRTYHTNAYGNALDNVLAGNSGNNRLDGGGGNDTASYAASTKAVVANLTTGLATGQGSDTLVGMENLTGSAYNDKLYGDGNANRIDGGAGYDSLLGGAGNDILSSGAGNDKFVFNSALDAATNVDTLTDYNPAKDIIYLENAGAGLFNTLANGALAAPAFHAGAGLTAATEADDRIVYDTSTGALYYDADGAGGTAAIQFAVLTSAPTLTSVEFFVM